MTRIEDMTEPQRQSWITLIADGTIFIWLLQRMLDGRSLIELSPGQLLTLFGVTVGLTIAAHIIIAIIFESRKKGSGESADERDADIARRGDRVGYCILACFVNVFIFMYLMQNAFGSDYQVSVNVTSPTAIFFWLIVAAYSADLAKHAIKLWHYHR